LDSLSKLGPTQRLGHFRLTPCVGRQKKKVSSPSSRGLPDSSRRATLLQASLADKMIEISLGQRLHELRDKADLSLRELARKAGISSPFLSDIELGRQFPSEEILAKLAGALKVPLEDLKQYDNREPIADLKRLMDSNPKLGFAFRTA